MKTVILSILFGSLLAFSARSAFLPEGNSDAFGLEYGESIAGVPPNTPKIDGNLDDWKYAVWVAFDSERELLRGKGAWKGKDDLTMTWSTMMDWNGLNPDDSANLGTLIFGGSLAVDAAGKLPLTWGQLKNSVQ